MGRHNGNCQNDCRCPTNESTFTVVEVEDVFDEAEDDSEILVNVTTLTRSWRTQIRLDGSDTVGDLKKAINAERELESDTSHLRLHFNGRTLYNDSATLSSCGVTSACTLYVVLPLHASGKKRMSHHDILKGVQEQVDSQKASKEAKVAKKVETKARKKGRHPTKILLRNFTPAEFNAWYEEIKAMALEVKNDTTANQPKSGQHIPIYDVLLRNNIRTIIYEVMRTSKMNRQAQKFNNLDEVIKFFAENDVDITGFCDDLQARYDKDVGDNRCCKFLKRMILYTIRNEQYGCGKCGRKIEELIFGAIGFESNHVADDNATSDDERIKCFEASITKFLTGDLVDTLFEICKTRLECWRCHNHFGVSRFNELPDTCEGDHTCEPVPFFIAQEKPECKKVLTWLTKIQNVASQAFESIRDTFDAETDFKPNDCFLFTGERWARADPSTRESMLYRVYLGVEKRMCGGCLRCGEKFCNLPVRELGGLDGHHVLEEMKLFNPSEGAKKTIDESLKENRKLAPLCKKCHIFIHHKVGENDRFMETLRSKYGVDVSLVDGELFRIPS
jgi:hypothetical protein